MYLTKEKSLEGPCQYGLVDRFLLAAADLAMEVLGEPEGTLFDDDDSDFCNALPSASCMVSDDETSRISSDDEPGSDSDRSLLVSSVSDDVKVPAIVLATTKKSTKRHALDYLADQVFHLVGFAFVLCMGMLMRSFLKTIGTDTGIAAWEECRDALRLLLTHNHGIPFWGMLVFMKVSQYIVYTWVYQPVLTRLYEGTNEKYASYYCEWLCEAVKKTIMFAIGLSVALGSDWVPRPALSDTWLWIPKQGGTIFDAHGDIVPTCAIALEAIAHMEVTDDTVSLIVLLYDRLVEWLGHNDESPKKTATTTTSFAEDFVHHTGVVTAGFFIYIVAKDNCNAVAIVILLTQVSDLFEYWALVLGLCKNWYLECLVTPTLMVLWTVCVLYIWPAISIPIALESLPIEQSFDPHVVLSLTIYQIACVLISLLYWAMHVFWLYKSVVFFYKYHLGVYRSPKKTSCP